MLRAHKHRHVKRHKASLADRHILPALPEEEIRTEGPIVGGQQLERKHTLAEDLHDWILGGQDGIVNVLGSILGVAVITNRKEVIIVAGLAALFAESISMAAVAYTSVKASHSYYHSERLAVAKQIEENPVLQREVLIDVYEQKGFTRTNAGRIVDELTKNKHVWLDTLMEERMKMSPPEDAGPLHSAFIVGMASLIGAAIPVLPFFFMERELAIIWSCITSVIVLFGAGAAAAKLTIGDWKTRGIEMALIGSAAAAISFAIGWAFTTGLVTV